MNGKFDLVTTVTRSIEHLFRLKESVDSGERVLIDEPGERQGLLKFSEPGGQMVMSFEVDMLNRVIWMGYYDLESDERKEVQLNLMDLQRVLESPNSFAMPDTAKLYADKVNEIMKWHMGILNERYQVELDGFLDRVEGKAKEDSVTSSIIV